MNIFKTSQRILIVSTFFLLSFVLCFTSCEDKESGESPIAKFYAESTTVEYGELVIFREFSENNPTAWDWDFGDGETSNEKNPNHLYEEAGTYTVSFIASNENGESTEIKEDYIEVKSGELPKVDFSSDYAITDIRTPINFHITKENESVTYLWDFGDEDTSTEEDPSHVYLSVGFHTVSLTITNQFGDKTNVKEDYIKVYEYMLEDIDQNRYEYVIINDQAWMAEDLQVTNTKNGNSLSFVSNHEDWKNLFNEGIDKAYCNSLNANAMLYTYSAATEICPAGWHLPSDNEWKELEIYMGMSIEELDSIGWRGEGLATKIKSETGWGETYVGTNDYGFNAMLAGWANEATVNLNNNSSMYWTSTEFMEGAPYLRYIGDHTDKIKRDWQSKYRGISVRCLKD
jgi:uncharacterized protein (TIGR02145 family)